MKHFIPGHTMIDQSDALGLRTFKQCATHQEFLGLADANQQRPDDDAAVARDEPDTADMSVAHARVLGQYR